MSQDTPKAKPCRDCLHILPLLEEFFYRDKRSTDGFHSYCKRCHRARNKRWGDENRSLVRERSRQWTQDNPERQYARRKRWREENREYDNAIAQRNREKNPEKHRAAVRAWRERNPFQARAGYARDAARKFGDDGTLTGPEIRQRYKSQRGHCHWCACKLHGNDFHVDHVVPLSRGGANAAENIVIACATCNISKGAKTPDEWRASK